jgi:hypothetical protein
MLCQVRLFSMLMSTRWTPQVNLAGGLKELRSNQTATKVTYLGTWLVEEHVQAPLGLNLRSATAKLITSPFRRCFVARKTTLFRQLNICPQPGRSLPVHFLLSLHSLAIKLTSASRFFVFSPARINLPVWQCHCEGRLSSPKSILPPRAYFRPWDPSTKH